MLGSVTFGQTGLVTLNCKLRIDDLSNFSFSRLRGEVQYRLNGEDRWISHGLSVPDNNGNFSVSIPRSSLVLLVIDTSDPTVRQASSASESYFYSLSSGLDWQTVARLRFAIPDSSKVSVERVIELRRGAAFYPNVPFSVNEGGVYFRRAAARDAEGTNVVWFWPGSDIHAEIIGGLEPGKWSVAVYDEKSSSPKQIYRQTLNLPRGKIVSLP